MWLQPNTLLQGGKYKIIRTLGQGGFGITYEAEQVSLGRRVAIKEFFLKDCCERVSDSSEMIVPTQNNRGLVEKFKNKFLREARLIASFNHPHIVRVMDVFEENNTAYYVMDLLSGGSIADMVKKDGPQDEGTAEKYIRQIADALSYIHAHNTVHFDVKPSNILLNDNGESVLIDFGLSKHYDELGEQTTTSSVGYSPGYAPLEQSRLVDVSQFKPSTDIYSLGATLFFLLTGVTPPDASIVNEEGLSRPANISTRLWNVIERAMKPRQKERFQGVKAFIVQLDTEKSIQPNDVEDTIINNKPTPSNSPKNNSGKWMIAILVCILLSVVSFLIYKASLKADQREPIAINGINNGHEWVDLGLSVKWATCNVGALNPTEFGNYFAWGETSPKDYYSLKNYKFYVSGDLDTRVVFSKYVCEKERGSIDNKRRLDYSDDAANVNWGGTWRMPTASEWDELINNCTWTLVEQPERYGFDVMSNINGNSIFIPMLHTKTSGDRANNWDGTEPDDYWSSSLDEGFNIFASFVILSSHPMPMTAYRYFGRWVRAVTK